MKKQPLFIFFTFSYFWLNAQSVTIDLTGGYNAPLASTLRAEKVVEVENTGIPNYYVTYEKTKAVSYGQGGNLAFNFCWHSKKNIGFGIRLNALFSQSFSSSLSVKNLDATTTSVNYKQSPFSFQFIPYFSFKHEFKKVTPFVEAGILIGATQISNTIKLTNSNSNLRYEIGQVDDGGAIIGFHARLGILVNITPKFKFVTALESNVGSYSPTAWHLNKYEINGRDFLSQVNPTSREGSFTSVYNANNSTNPNNANSKTKYKSSFSGIGINVGFAFVFQSKTKEKKGKAEKAQHFY